MEPGIRQNNHNYDFVQVPVRSQGSEESPEARGHSRQWWQTLDAKKVSQRCPTHMAIASSRRTTQKSRIACRSKRRSASDLCTPGICSKNRLFTDGQVFFSAPGSRSIWSSPILSCTPPSGNLQIFLVVGLHSACFSTIQDLLTSMHRIRWPALSPSHVRMQNCATTMGQYLHDALTVCSTCAATTSSIQERVGSPTSL